MTDLNQPDPPERLARARLSLDGLSVGDALGETYLRSRLHRHYIRKRLLFEGPWRWTDDTVLAAGLVDCLARHGRVVQDQLARRFAELYMADPDRGYGLGAATLLEAIARGGDWRRLASDSFGGQGSMGNGSAMRAGPVGAYFADDLDAVVEQAKLSAQVTHMHPDGQAGAVAVALAAALAWRWRNDPSCWPELIPAVIERTGEGPTREALMAAERLPAETTIQRAAQVLGNGDYITCQDTVPFCLWCASRHMNSYSQVLWRTLEAFGDMDTNCAIVGSIVVLAGGAESIPPSWLARREALPAV